MLWTPRPLGISPTPLEGMPITNWNASFSSVRSSSTTVNETVFSVSSDAKLREPL